VKTVESEVIAMSDEWAKEPKAVKKTKPKTPHILAPLALLVICLFLMPSPSSLPSFQEGSCPNPLDQPPFVGNSASSCPAI